MKNNIYILNGYQGSGKDTVAHIVNEAHAVVLFSTIDTVKEICCIFGYKAERMPGIQGWKEEKTPDDRRRMSDLKDYLTRKFDLPFVEACQIIDKHISSNNDDEYLFLMVREPTEIQKLKDKYPFIKSVFVDAKTRLGNLTFSNHADAEVENYKYDIIIDNNSDISGLRQEVKNKIIKGSVRKLRYKETLFIPPSESRMLLGWLNSVGQGENNTYIQSVRFQNGIEADVKCCGCQDEPSWTEMVLFENGHEVCCTDVRDQYLGEWSLDFNNDTYTVTVEEEPLCWNCAYVGYNKRFPQPNNKIIRRYYCNCEDCPRYRYDITGKAIHVCKYFEEI